MTADFGQRLPRSFFERPTLDVARGLLGQRLVRIEAGGPVGGRILETEAYIGEQDGACHARAGRTARTEVMYGPPGHAYLYFTYGMHWMFNIVTEAQGQPAAVLVRAIAPEYGLDRIAARRSGRARAVWTDGPGKLCQALGLHGDHYGLDLCNPSSPVSIAAAEPVPDASVTTGPRVGLNKVDEPWKSIPWRFRVTALPPDRASGSAPG